MTMTPNDHLIEAERLLDEAAYRWTEGEKSTSASTRAIAHIQLALAKVARTKAATGSEVLAWKGDSDG
jgi:hypothetical protein